MTKEQEEHLVDIKIKANGLLDAKYRRGALEHEKSDPLLTMSLMDCLDNAIEENIDQLIFLMTAKSKLQTLILNKTND